MELITYNFTAILSLFPTELGGRKKPVYDNYKPSFSFNSRNHVSGEISFTESKELKPGESATVTVKLLPSRVLRHNLKSGDSFSIHEGAKVIGSGIIQRIIEDRIVPALT